MREEAIRDPLWVLADFAPRELGNRAALRWAGDVLAALASYVVLRSEMEQVGWLVPAGSLFPLSSDQGGAAERYDWKPVFVLRAGGGEDQ